MKKPTYRLVKNANNWNEMDGDTELEKRINSYLTCQFIIPTDIPSDECLKEAKEIIKMIKHYYVYMPE